MTYPTNYNGSLGSYVPSCLPSGIQPQTESDSANLRFDPQDCVPFAGFPLNVASYETQVSLNPLAADIPADPKHHVLMNNCPWIHISLAGNYSER